MEESVRILDKLLRFYETYFDIERPFPAGGIIYDAYGYFHMENTKYMLVKEAQMWKTYLFEHVFFRVMDVFSSGDLQEYKYQRRECLEPEFVRKGEKYPMPDHMCTSLTNIFICRRAVAGEAARRVHRDRFHLYYRFALRGYCEGRLAVIDLEKRKIYGNPAARQLVKDYRRLFRREGIK